jgi:formylglycine-generating enzyme required for sulfatase activity
MKSVLLRFSIFVGFAVLSVVAESSAFFRISGSADSGITEIMADGMVTWTNADPAGTYTFQSNRSPEVPGSWVDHVQVAAAGPATTNWLFDLHPPSGFVLIPAGSFEMGDTFGDGYEWELPVHTVHVSAFYIQTTEVTNDEMLEVMRWAYSQGKISVTTRTVRNREGDPQELLDLDSGDCRITWNGTQFGIKGAKGAGYPCVEVTWYGAVAFCNYRSEMEGRTPCYDLDDWTCDWNADGYRLPTEAEWEKAARGGPSGLRFPWGASIDHDWANVLANGSAYPYDVSPYTEDTHHPSYDDGSDLHTSPVGSFAPTGHGRTLYDMAGNVSEWCLDWFSTTYYERSAISDPRGPDSAVYRTKRGGSWADGAFYCRVASRVSGNAGYSEGYSGLRCVLPAVP